MSSSNQAIGVFLFGQPMANMFIYDNKICFQYTPEFLQRNINPAPISLPFIKDIIPCNSNIHNNGLPSMIADSLPDKFGKEVFIDFCKANNIDQDNLSPLEKLSYVGEHGMGALTYHPAKSISDIGDFTIDMLSRYAENKIEQRIKKLKLDLSKEIDRVNLLALISGSIGGARPKAIIYRSGEKIISGYLPTAPAGYSAEIIKLTTTHGEDYGKTEHIYQEIAKSVGISTMPTEIIEVKGHSHFVIKRFDREEGKKLHVQTYAGLFDIDFNTTPMRLEDCLAAIVELTGDQQQVNDMFTRMLFNIVSGNYDDHAKNTSFIMNERGEWRLSPAYDLTYEYHSGAAWYAEHHTSMNGKKRNWTLDDIEKVGQVYGIKKPKELFEKVETVFNEKFPQLAKEYGISDERKKVIIDNTRIFQKQIGKGVTLVPPSRKTKRGMKL